VVERLVSEDPELRRRLERTERELGKTRLELAARIRAEPGPAQVAVAKGDQLELGADLVVRETKGGAYLLEGTLSAWTWPSRELLLRQAYSSPATVAVRPPPAEPCLAAQDRPWRVGGVGGVGGVSGQGWLAGAAYTRRLDVFGWRPELLATAAGGPGGVVLLAGVAF
jgi:hypothetical protein